MPLPLHFLVLCLLLRVMAALLTVCLRPLTLEDIYETHVIRRVDPCIQTAFRTPLRRFTGWMQLSLHLLTDSRRACKAARDRRPRSLLLWAITALPRLLCVSSLWSGVPQKLQLALIMPSRKTRRSCSGTSGWA